MPVRDFVTGSGDCYGSPLGFSSILTYIVIGDNSATGANLKAWLPFVVSIRKGTLITTATLKVISYNSNSETTVKVLIGCEDADNPATPISWADLDARVMTTAYTTDNNVAAWTEGTEYTWDVTTAVQEVLDRAGWVYGNTLAVLIWDNSSTTDKKRAFASSENETYNEAVLSIDYTGDGQVLNWSGY